MSQDPAPASPAEDDPDSAATEPEAPPASKPARGGDRRWLWTGRIVLFLVLGAMIAALVWERRARREAGEAAARLDDLMDCRKTLTAPKTIEWLRQHDITEPPAVIGPNEVAKVIGHAATTDTPQKHGQRGEWFLETYRWRSGLPWTSYYLHVIYRPSQKDESKLELIDYWHNQPVDETQAALRARST